MLLLGEQAERVVEVAKEVQAQPEFLVRDLAVLQEDGLVGRGELNRLLELRVRLAELAHSYLLQRPGQIIDLWPLLLSVLLTIVPFPRDVRNLPDNKVLGPGRHRSIDKVIAAHFCLELIKFIDLIEIFCIMMK